MLVIVKIWILLSRLFYQMSSLKISMCNIYNIYNIINVTCCYMVIKVANIVDISKTKRVLYLYKFFTKIGVTRHLSVRLKRWPFKTINYFNSFGSKLYWKRFLQHFNPRLKKRISKRSVVFTYIYRNAVQNMLQNESLLPLQLKLSMYNRLYRSYVFFFFKPLPGFKYLKVSVKTRGIGAIKRRFLPVNFNLFYRLHGYSLLNIQLLDSSNNFGNYSGFLYKLASSYSRSIFDCNYNNSKLYNRHMFHFRKNFVKKTKMFKTLKLRIKPIVLQKYQARSSKVFNLKRRNVLTSLCNRPYITNMYTEQRYLLLFKKDSHPLNLSVQSKFFILQNKLIASKKLHISFLKFFRILNIVSSQLFIEKTRLIQHPNSVKIQQHILFNKVFSTKSWQYNIVLAAKKRNTWVSFISSPITGSIGRIRFKKLSRTIFNFSTMQIGVVYTLSRRYKNSVVLKLLMARFIRRYLIILNIRKIALRLKNGIDNFQTMWSAITTPLDEIFYHPIKKTLVGDLNLLVDYRVGILNQIDSFFESQYIKFEPHYSSLKTKDAFDKDWFKFRNEFLTRCLEVQKDGISPNKRLFWNYVFQCNYITFLNSFARSKNYTKPQRSIRRRISKRITAETQQRFWVF